MIESRWKIILEPNIKHSNYNKIFSLYRIEYKRGTSVLLWVVNSTFRIMDNCSFQALHTGHEVTNMAQYAYMHTFLWTCMEKGTAAFHDGWWVFWGPCRMLMCDQNLRLAHCHSIPFCILLGDGSMIRFPRS